MWDVFWPTLQKDGSLVFRVGTLAIPDDMRTRFGLPAIPLENNDADDFFGGFCVTASRSPEGYVLVFSDVALVTPAEPQTTPHYKPQYRPGWEFWDGTRKAFLESLTEHGIKASAGPPSTTERTTGDPFETQRMLMGLGDPLNNQ
jgi:hypothetical protein